MAEESPVIKTGVSQKNIPEEAVQELYEAIYQPNVSFAVFYCSPNYDLDRLEKALAEKFVGIPLIGCTTAGEITPEGFLEGSITGVTISSDKLKSKAVLLPLDNLTGDQVRLAHQSLYEQMVGQDLCDSPVCEYPICDVGVCEGLNGFAFLLIDGLSNMEERVMGALSEVLAALPLVGGSAADGARFEQTHIYYDSKFHTNCAVLSLVCTSLPFYLFKTESFEGTERRLVITEADAASRTVQEIDGLPAATGYAEAAGVTEDQLSFDFFANNPVAVKLGGDYFIRSIAPNKEAYSSQLSKGLKFSCAIDEGVVLSMAKSVDVVENLSSAFNTMREKIGEPLLTLGFDCLYRNSQYGKENKAEEIAELMQKNRVIGFHTYGEQYGSLHVNQTFTAVAFGREKAQ